MRLLKLFPLVLLCLASPAVSGQTILPKTFGNWTANSQGAFDASTAPQQAAAAAREYGFASGERASYVRSAVASVSTPPAAADTLTVTLYRMKDVSGAYGQYSYLRAPEMERANFTDHSSLKPDEALILTGNLVLDVSGPAAAKSAADINALVAAVASRAQEGPLPSLPEHLPLENRVDRSDHYILGPQTLDQFFPGDIGYSLGFAYGTEAETARFHAKGHELTLLIADFPTPQIAQSQLQLLQQKFNINGSQSSGGSPALFASRSQTMLAIVSGAASSEEASKLLDQVKAGTVLTWSEPTFQFKEPSIEMMVVGAIVGTGIICLFSVVAGLAFGGFRLAIKRLFPGKVFDRTSQMDVLQLGLTTNPIKTEDFYRFEGLIVKGVKVDKNLPDRIALRIFR